MFRQASVRVSTERLQGLRGLALMSSALYTMHNKQAFCPSFAPILPHNAHNVPASLSEAEVGRERWSFIVDSKVC
jgi:hypothetical protein